MLVQLHTAVQFLVFIVSFMSFVFYAYQKWQGQSRVDWEIIYVVAIEVMLYSMLMGMPEDYINLYGTVPILRYMSWLTTCPVLLSSVLNLLTGKRDFQMIAFIWILDTWITIFGILSAVYWGPLKHICYGLAFVTMAAMYAELLKISETERVKSLPKYGERKRLLQFLMVTWLIFPVLFSIGPEYGAVITFQQSAMFHAIGDLLSKNLMGFFSWNLGNSMLNELERNKPEEKDDDYGMNIHAMKNEMGPVAKVVKRGNGRGAYRRIRNGPVTFPSIIDRIVNIERMLTGDFGETNKSAPPGEKAEIMQEEATDEMKMESKIHEHLGRYHLANSHSVGPDHSFGSTPSPSHRPFIGDVFPLMGRHMNYTPMRSQPSSPAQSTSTEEKVERRDMDVE